MLLIVNYHYLGDERQYPQGIYPISPERFTRQLAIIGRHFSFVSEAQILEAVQGGKPLPERACLISFDDGLRSQYEVALPLLTARGIPALFFVNGSPYREERAPLVHKIHWCRAHLSPRAFLDRVTDAYRGITGARLDLDSLAFRSDELRTHYHYDSLEEAKVKFVLDRGFGDPAVREAVVARIFAAIAPREDEFCRSFYIPREGLRELSRLGYLGIHTYSHKPLALYSLSVCREEIERCMAIMPKILGKDAPRIASISYPYGNKEIIPSFITETVRAAGLSLGFTMERSLNRTLAQPYLLARVDTNDAPGGKAPGFEMKGESVVLTGDRVRESRSEHFIEV